MDVYQAESLRHDYEQDLRDDLIELGYEDEDELENEPIASEPETPESQAV
jgi:hypothetical protein